MLSCLAGEGVHFYNEVLELGKIPFDDPAKRIYMARHIIQRYINTGALPFFSVACPESSCNLCLF